MTVCMSHKNQLSSSITPAVQLMRFPLFLKEVGTPRLPMNSTCDSVGLLRKLYPSDSRTTQETPLFHRALFTESIEQYPGLMGLTEHRNWCGHRAVTSVAIGDSFPLSARVGSGLCRT